MNTNIYVGQPFTIRLNTKTNLTEATSLRIRVKREDPESAAMFYNAELVEGSDTVIETFIPSADNTVAGLTEFRAWVIFPGDPAPVPGTPFKFKIQEV